MFFKIDVLKNVTNFTGEACNFIKKRFQQRCVPVKFARFLRTPFLTEHPQWLLLKKRYEIQKKNLFKAKFWSDVSKLKIDNSKSFTYAVSREPFPVNTWINGHYTKSLLSPSNWKLQLFRIPRSSTDNL